MSVVDNMLDRYDAGLGLIENTDEWSYGNVVDEMRTSLIYYHGPDSKPMDRNPWEAMSRLGARGLIRLFLETKVKDVRRRNSLLSPWEAYDLAFELCSSVEDLQELHRLADRQHNKGNMTRETYVHVVGALMAVRINLGL